MPALPAAALTTAPPPRPTPPPDATVPASVPPWLVPVLLALLALVLRAPGLGLGVDTDEYALVTRGRSLLDVWFHRESANNPPLLHALVNALAPRHPVPLGRAVALAAGALSAPAAWWAGSRLAGPIAGALAGLWIAADPNLVEHGALFRGYAPFVLVALARGPLVAARLGHERLTWRRDGVASLATAALPWLHYTGVVVVLVEGLGLAATRRVCRARWAAWYLPAAASLLPFVPLMAEGGRHWVTGREPLSRTLGQVVGLGYPLPRPALHLVPDGLLAGLTGDDLALLSAAGVLALAALGAAWGRRGAPGIALLLGLDLAGALVAVPLLATVHVVRPAVAAVVLAFAAPLGAAAVGWARPGIARGAAAALLVAWGAGALVDPWSALGERRAHRAAEGALVAAIRAGPGDTVVVVPSGRMQDVQHAVQGATPRPADGVPCPGETCWTVEGVRWIGGDAPPPPGAWVLQLGRPSTAPCDPLRTNPAGRLARCGPDRDAADP